MADLTPMMQQYLEIKKAHPDSLLFFRLGDFYEMFNDDARIAARELDLTLTSRNHGKYKKSPDETIPMCGVPYHACDSYIARLIAKGYKVAICEQMEDPATAKGLVKRDILRVVTPGTVMDTASLDERHSNYLCALYLDNPISDEKLSRHVKAGRKLAENPVMSVEDKGLYTEYFENFASPEPRPKSDAAKEAEAARKNGVLPPIPASAGAAFCDLTTGEIRVASFHGPDRVTHLTNELGRYSPVEAILSAGAFSCLPLVMTLRDRYACHMENAAPRFDADTAKELIQRQFGENGAAILNGKESASLALGALLSYLYETQKTDLSHINRIDYDEQSRFMELDLDARRNLELTRTNRDRERKGSLLWVLDKTRTPMGARLLRGWLERPLLRVTDIRRRNGAVAALVDNAIGREELTAALTGLGDMERLTGRIVYGTAGPREVVLLRTAMEKIPQIRACLSVFSDRLLKEVLNEMDTLEDLAARIAAALDDEPPVTVRDGGFIRDGYNEQVDHFRSILKGGKGVIMEMEAQEREKTGIRSLKIRYNKVFGYYIEVSNTFKGQAPERYIRKQTLANAERYITPELKELEESVLTASERLNTLEYELFEALRKDLTEAVSRITRTAQAVAGADALASLATVAVENRYCCPEVDESSVIEIHDGRHPVVERMLKDGLFVPNDTFMGEAEQRIGILTGPNMAGKSTYMRQVALIVLMAQIGSFIPATSARIGIVDRIFTRVGASDDLAAGQSTFMVEMTEVAEILRCATSRSLLILDEIGRGTSTYDGMSIARAVLEHCAKKIKAKTLFATHYHELTELAQTLPGTANYTIAVKAKGEDIVFLRKIIPGGADRSYGIEVAKLAGLPPQVLARARVILKELEEESGKPRSAAPIEDAAQVSMASMAEQSVLDALRRCQPDSLTPMEAMSLLYEWKKALS
ncbi:MAG: DNA mismatch repair protein MutS [Oscillibacter sp.]|nr:DNA mismatch repair protein MutS [Oscillibacter sp.]